MSGGENIFPVEIENALARASRRGPGGRGGRARRPLGRGGGGRGRPRRRSAPRTPPTSRRSCARDWRPSRCPAASSSPTTSPAPRRARSRSTWSGTSSVGRPRTCRSVTPTVRPARPPPGRRADGGRGARRPRWRGAAGCIDTAPRGPARRRPRRRLVVDASTTAALDAAAWSTLASSLSGRLVLPSSPSYATARLLYDPRFDTSTPAAVAYCASPADVQRCIGFARAHGIRPIPRCGGHSYAGYSSGPVSSSTSRP